MHPHKFKSFSEPLAQQFDLSSETVNQVAQVYFLHVQRQLSSLQYQGVDMPGLGVFFLKGNAAVRKASKLSTLLENSSAETSGRAVNIRTERLRDYALLTQLTRTHLLEKQRKATLRQQRYEKPDPGTEEFGTDSRGNTKQCV